MKDRIYEGIQNALCVSEEDSSLTEYQLQLAWLEQKAFSTLRTCNGESIEVLSPGIWNKEAGPDFIRAHLRIGNRTYKGDVEIHLNEDGWYQHDHHCDARYNQVILHLSYFHSKTKKRIHKENGQEPFSCYLEDFEIDLLNLRKSTDLDCYSSSFYFQNEGRCSKELFSILPEDDIKVFLQSAAYWRLERKLNFLKRRFTTESMQLLAGFAMTLGYKDNALAFLDLFSYLFSHRDCPFEELLAMAIGSCGFLEINRKKNWESSSYYLHLRSIWEAKRPLMTHQTHLQLHQIRPLHHPLRRLVYLVYLLQDRKADHLWSNLLALWKSSKELFSKQEQFKQKFFNLLPNYSHPYWDRHYTFEIIPQSKLLPYLGSDLKSNFLINIALPLLYDTLRREGNIEEWKRFQHFYSSLKNTKTTKSHYLNHRFFGSKSTSLFSQAEMVQGAYQIHHDFCMQYETSCQGCPFVERYKSTRFKQISFS